MHRGVTLAQVRNAVQLCRNNGIGTGMFLMWGYDGEEIEDLFDETYVAIDGTNPQQHRTRFLAWAERALPELQAVMTATSTAAQSNVLSIGQL